MENDYLILNNNCLSSPHMAPDKEQELAILFLDIRNFTGLMESQPGQTVIQTVRRLFTAFNKIINNFHGKVVEVAGDNLYAIFGLQTNLREAANEAYQAIKIMMQTVSLFNEAYGIPYYGGPLEIGIGLHTGSVFVGEFGLDEPAKLSVMGLPVNIAARLQAKTKELNNDLLISEETYLLLDATDGDFSTEVVYLQGISHPQQVRLAGKAYDNQNYLAGPQQQVDYLLAISG